MKHQRGSALIITLWALAMLSITMGAVVQAIRLENRQSAYELHHLAALLAAEAGFALVIQDMASPRSEILVDGRPYPLTFEDTQLTIEVYSERGKLDLNFAKIESFTKLAMHFGASATQAQKLARELDERRAKSSPIKAIEELQQFQGMDSRLYIQMEPYLTLWTGLAQPDQSFAQDQVRAALKLGAPLSNSNPGTVLNVKIHAVNITGTSARLDVTFFFTPQGGNAQLYRVLRWQE